MEPIIRYGNETDDEIVKRHMRRELQTWISHLDVISNEAKQLEKIIAKRLNDTELKRVLLENLKENSNLLDEFYSYRNDMNNVRECDEVSCDQFYKNQHDQVFEKYIESITKYRSIKDKVYHKLLD